MGYSATQIRVLPWPNRHPQPGGTYVEEWELLLEDVLPVDVAATGDALRETALRGIASTLRAQGYPDLLPTDEETRPFRVEVAASGPNAVRLRLQLVDVAPASLSLALTAHTWIAVEGRLSRIRSIQGVERQAWRMFLGPPE